MTSRLRQMRYLARAKLTQRRFTAWATPRASGDMERGFAIQRAGRCPRG